MRDLCATNRAAVLCALTAFLPLAAVAAEQAPPRRVLLLDTSADGIEPTARAELPDLVAAEFARDGRLELVNAAQTATAVAARQSDARRCLEDVLCLDAVANTVRAELVLSAALEPARKGYVLTMTVGRPAAFMLMPFMHAEDVGLQQKGLDGFIKLRDAATDEKLRASFDNSVRFARLHKAIIERFGLFPHRNAILGRPISSEEAEFLKEPHSSF
jgi:uncharacterized protein (DUF924 family)